MNAYILTFLVSIGVSPLLAVELPIELDFDGCQKPRTVQNFNPRRFEGLWYDVQRNRNNVFDGDCATATFTWNDNKESYNMAYESLDASEDFELRAQNPRNGELRLYRRGRRTPMTILVLDTDYNNYAVVWSCTDIMYGVGSVQTLNILSRTRTLDSSQLSIAKDVIRNRDLQDTRLQRVTQDRSACRKRREYN